MRRRLPDTEHLDTQSRCGPTSRPPARARRFALPVVRDLDTSRLRIAMLAPPWIPIPAPGYGGIEAVVEVLCERLVAAGHHVALFAAAGTRSPAEVHEVLARQLPEAMGQALPEADHVARVFAEIDHAARTGRPFDVVHDHSGFVALAMADRLRTPLVHTVHGPFTQEAWAFYERHAAKALVVGLSRSQLASGPPALADALCIPNPIDLGRWPLVSVKSGYLLWIGRMEAVKGPHRAIEVAARSGHRLVLAGPVQPGQEAYFAKAVAPGIDGKRVCYVGDVSGRTKVELFAHAAALLMPIRWEEPFGMVMIEALACGTPVLAFAEGAAAEIVLDGQNGFLVEDEDEMVAAIARLSELDPVGCRASVAARYDADLVTNAYERAYRRACARPAVRPPERPSPSGRADPAGGRASAAPANITSP
jgi:glycosyltransferase involved in cell wall biosynthesis